jgi:hypothetical protein
MRKNLPSTFKGQTSQTMDKYRLAGKIIKGRQLMRLIGQLRQERISIQPNSDTV